MMNKINTIFIISLAFIFIIILSPLFLLIILLIKITSKGPVFFQQTRVGKLGKTFQIIKFRTMIPNAEHIGSKINISAQDDRITPIGSYLRRYSLDELPQLINIVKGDMNFIGPRPTIPSQVKKYTATQAQRLLIKPGITGWAQVNGRNNLTWPDRINLDIWYIKNKSLRLNLIIILRTAATLLSKKGIYTK